MAITHQDVHVLTHTARILAVLDRDPGHVRQSEYEQSLARYQAHWLSYSDDQRDAIRDAAEQLSELSAETIERAATYLTGARATEG